MPIDDIVYDYNYNLNSIVEINIGYSGSVTDILTESGSGTSPLVNEIPAQTGGATEYAFAF